MTKKDRDELIRQILQELPCAIANGGYYTVKRSQLVMWVLGKYPTKNEVIHHKNENKLDDRPENLEILSRSEHAKIHMKDKWVSGKFDRSGTTQTEKQKSVARVFMQGNQHARGAKHTPEQRLAASEERNRRYENPVARQLMSERTKEVWRKRRDGLLPMPKPARKSEQDTIH